MSPVRVVAHDRPDDVLAALDSPDLSSGPVAVVDPRRPDVVRSLDDAMAAHRPPDDTWLVALTSGSLAAPRAVCRTRDSWASSVDAFASLSGVTETSTVLVPGPLSSTLYLFAAWHTRTVGARLVLPDARGGRVGNLAGDLVRMAAWDVAHVVPGQLADLLDADADDADIGAGGSLEGRTVVVAGAGLSDRVAARAQQRGLRVLAYYGATELSLVAMGPAGQMRAFPGADVEARDGELWVGSPYVATCYLGGDRVDGPWRRSRDGWSTVGDRGEVLEDGTVVVHGRGGAAVQTGGATVQVSDVEHALRRHPDVTDVVVVGIAHPTLGQVVAAAVESSTVTVPQLRSWARETLDPPARPRRWHVTARLTRGPSGKADPTAVRSLLGGADGMHDNGRR